MLNDPSQASNITDRIFRVKKLSQYRPGQALWAAGY
jgi:hypothetical protein